MKHFFIYSLPRSRTAWLANFLTYENSYCFHEGLLQARSVDQLRELFSSTGKPTVGNSDCGNLFFLEEIRETFPESRSILIERPIEEVLESLRDMGPEFSDEMGVEQAYLLMQELKRDPTVLVVDYHDLSINALDRIWEWCIGTPFDRQRAVMLDGFDVQIILEKKLRQIREIEDKTWLMEALN